MSVSESKVKKVGFVNPTGGQLIWNAMSTQRQIRASRQKSASPGRKDGKSRSKSPPKSGRSSRSKSPPKSGKSRSKSPPKQVRIAASAKSGSSEGTGIASANQKERGLKVLDYSDQGMTSVPISLFIGNSLTGVLNLSSNNLRSIPSAVYKMESLFRIDLSRNGIRCNHPNDYGGLPKEMENLKDLEIFAISECNLLFVPPAIWRLKTLLKLDLSRNKFNILFPEIGQLTNLKHLNLQQTNIVTLPPEIAYCQDLEEILLWGNTIESLPDTLKMMKRLKRLSMNHRSFCAGIDSYMENLLRKGQIQSEHIPPVLFELPGLELLDLEGTKINNLPEKCLPSLRELYLNKNFFQTMPSAVFYLKHIKVLDISNNVIKKVPKEIGNIKTIEVLRMNNNIIEHVPSAIGKLINLLELEMSGNLISTLPRKLGNLSKLKRLMLGHNKIAELPDSICELRALGTLDLTDNKLVSLPMQLFQLENISSAHSYRKLHQTGLWLHNNPLTTPPQEIWKTDDHLKIFEYLKKLQILTIKNLKRQKMLVIGDSQAGKTTLINTLIQHKSMLTNGVDDSTSILEQNQWKTENNVRFTVFDFGGDSTYKIMHPMFLDPKALILLVYDHRKYTEQGHQEAIGYWIDMLHMHTPGAVVKLVGTHIDLCYEGIIESTTEAVTQQVQQQLDAHTQKLQDELNKIERQLATAERTNNQAALGTLQKQKNKIQVLINNPLRVIPDVSLVSCSQDLTGVSQLEGDVERLVIDKTLFPYAQNPVPPIWDRLGARMKNLKERYITWPIVRNCGVKLGIEDDTLVRALTYLCDTGEIMWFPNLHHLRMVVFHKPRLLINLIHGLYRHNINNFLDFSENRTLASKGQFTVDTFEEAKMNFLTLGQVSRPLMNCFWFYLKLSYEEFNELVDFVPLLDICYTIPQSEVPVRKSEYDPLVVIPWYNKDPKPDDLDSIWPPELPSDHTEQELTYTFPIQVPDGLFEKLLARIQDFVKSRIDWRDLTYATIENGVVLIERKLNAATYDYIISTTVRTTEPLSAHELFNQIKDIMQELTSFSQGAIYSIALQ